MLAIDLSLASLAYAQRKAARARRRQYRIRPGRHPGIRARTARFDVIEASGVLHHLADPMRGWARLAAAAQAGRLHAARPLQRARARRTSSLAREFVANGGYDATPESIRRCRQNLMKPRDPRLRAILGSPDFYSISACRDLLFHVQEHRLTLAADRRIPGRASICALLGFELDAPALARYRARFPDDAAMTDLANWHLLRNRDIRIHSAACISSGCRRPDA